MSLANELPSSESGITALGCQYVASEYGATYMFLK